MDLDFTLKKYQELCEALQEEQYTTCTVYEYLTKYQSSNFDKPEGPKRSEGTKGPEQTEDPKRSEGHKQQSPKVAILRHDIDRKIGNALRMAKLEHDLGIQSSYYFRYPYTFKPEIIKQIQELGHEIGYHYETLSKAKGDVDKAASLFEEELAAFRTICEVKTICMHGKPLSPYDNRKIWKKYDFHDFGIEGEAYLSMAEKDLLYFTDTGRNWSGKNSMRDVMSSAGTPLIPLETTYDLIAWIGSSGKESLYLTIHPERWALSDLEWAFGYVVDQAVNTGKTIIMAMR